jgi:hypothetical protein
MDVHKIMALIDRRIKELTTGEAGPDAMRNGRIAMEDLKYELEDLIEREANWDRDGLQFPRLIAEIAATQDKLDIQALCESMDLPTGRVNELFDRADAAWERIKRETT